MKPTICFFTVTGGGEDYEFLLGSLEHHAALGHHVVLDTTEPPCARAFRNLPKTVHWVHDPSYGAGWKEFRFRAALKRALEIARAQGCDVVAQLDSDEYYAPDIMERVVPTASEFMVSLETVHWTPFGPRSFGPSELHARLWPSRMDVSWPVNTAWVASPHYNGNPDHHAVVQPPPGARRFTFEGHYHYHLHYLVGQKAQDTETARTTIQGWPDGDPARVVALPTPIRRWLSRGILPSLRYT